MKKNLKQKSVPAPKVDPYLEGLMAKLLERLVSLERKVDAVVAQTAAKPSAAAGAFIPHSNSHSHPSHHPNHQNQNQNQNQLQNQHQRTNQPSREFPRRERVMFEAVCADCSELCEVPFKPSEGRAIYCKECFAKRRASGSGQAAASIPPRAIPNTPQKPALSQSATALADPPAKQVKQTAQAQQAKKSPLKKKTKKK